MPFETFVFGLAVVALVAAGSPVAAAVFALAVVVTTVLLAVFDQWDE